LALYAVTTLAQGGAINDLKENCHRTRLKNSIRKKQKALKAFLSPPLPSESRLSLELSLRGLLERAQACVKIDSQLTENLKESSIREFLDILNSVPGVSGVTALHLLFEIGRIDRFPSKRQIVSWAGLCPRIHSSGGKTSRGHITKRGNAHVRRILFQAARASLRVKSNSFEGWYRRLAARKPGRVALVVLARKLLVVIYTLLKTRQTFLCAPLKAGIQVHSTAKKLVRGLTSEPMAPLLTILVNWLDTPRQFRDFLAGVFDSMYEEVRHEFQCFY